jgi:hypothetical protein
MSTRLTYHSKLRETALQELHSFVYLTTVSLVITAIETTIQWNSITNIDSLASPAQAVPFVLALACLVRVLYVYLVGDVDERFRVRYGRSVM